MKINKLLFLPIIALMVSCGSMIKASGVTKTSNDSYEPTDSSTIEVFTSSVPTKAYFEIGTIGVLRYTSAFVPKIRPTEDVIQDAKAQASSIGGHAIINYRESGDTEMTGTIIRYK